MLCHLSGAGPAGSGDRDSAGDRHSAGDAGNEVAVAYFSGLSAKLVLIFWAH